MSRANVARNARAATTRGRAGRPEGDALTDTLDRAVHAESWGYDRFWVAEHHAVPGIGSGSPAVLLAAIGARTTSIRLGSGGVMLPHHQPLVVAEQFLVLDALHPGRIDLGVGRTLGFTAPVRRALRHDVDGPDTFESDVAELRSYLRGTGDVTARPVAEHDVGLHVLATGRGVEVAARLGLPVVLGGPLLADDDVLGEVLARYRARFAGDRPRVTVSLDVTVADDDATARELALPEAWAMARARQTGEFPPLESPGAIRAQRWPAQVRTRVEDSLDRAVAGSPATVRRAIERLAERTGADEVLASTSTYDRDALLASDAALRDLVG